MLSGFHLFGEITLVGGIHAWQHEQGEAIGVKRDTLGALGDLIEMQYTGLKDMKAVEIFEGDIIQQHPISKYKSWEVKYTVSNGFDLSETADYEVIGNIYENPDLLK